MLRSKILVLVLIVVISFAKYYASAFIRRTGKKVVEKKEGEIDEAVWDLLLSSDKKDYERICTEYGVTDFRGMLKKLTEIKKQREEEQALVHCSPLL